MLILNTYTFVVSLCGSPWWSYFTFLFTFNPQVFVDGRKYGELDGTKDITGPPLIPTSSFGLQNVNPTGEV